MCDWARIQSSLHIFCFIFLMTTFTPWSGTLMGAISFYLTARFTFFIFKYQSVLDFKSIPRSLPFHLCPGDWSSDLNTQWFSLESWSLVSSYASLEVKGSSVWFDSNLIQRGESWHTAGSVTVGHRLAVLEWSSPADLHCLFSSYFLHPSNDIPQLSFLISLPW